MINCCQNKCENSSVAIDDELGLRTEMTRSGSMMVATGADAYGYNTRDELISSATGAAAQYAYQYDDIGNRLSSLDLGTNRTYVANSLNQYTQISNLCDSASLREEFLPLFDEDGNQTNVLTSTGIWSVTYNGENRPSVWTCGTTNIAMKYDRMGRRVEYVETDGATTNKHWKFVYNGFLCLQRLNGATNAITDLFEWDPTEPVATRPLYWQTRDGAAKHYFYLHDGNKNVANVVSYQRATGVVASYDYAPFGAATSATGSRDFPNPFRFSSEFHDDTLGLVYYNYRHYNPMTGRWLSRDPAENPQCNLYLCKRNQIVLFDSLGLEEFSCCGPDVTLWVSEELMILNSWISQINNMIQIWARQESFWYEPNFIREKSYAYTFMLIIGPRLTYFPDTNFSLNTKCSVSKRCRNTVTFHGRCVHSSEIGNFIYGFVARKFRMTWLQTLGGAILGNRGKLTNADMAAVEYGWDALDQGWWDKMEFPSDGNLADEMATDAPKECKPSKCATNVGHISLPIVTKELNYFSMTELQQQIQVPINKSKINPN